MGCGKGSGVVVVEVVVVGNSGREIRLKIKTEDQPASKVTHSTHPQQQHM